jgi:hypothetical protein
MYEKVKKKKKEKGRREMGPGGEDTKERKETMQKEDRS